MALNVVSSDRLSTNVKTSNLDTGLSGKVGENKNLVINGSQDIDQRNSGTEVNPVVNGNCVTDRFKYDLSAASKVKAQQVADGPTGFTKSLKVTSLAATTPGAADYYILQQMIEGLNSAHLGWGASGAKNVTLSFWVKSSLTGTFGVAIRNNGFDRTNVQTYAISSADTWEKKTITFTGDTSGTWLTTNGVGLRVGWDLGGGSNFDAASTGSWLATNDFTTSSCTHVVATNAATWQITGVQLEVGDTATEFEDRSYADELARCQRYFIQYADGHAWVGRMNGTGNSDGFFNFPVEMRTTPTGTESFNTAVMEVGSTAKTVDGMDCSGYGNRTAWARCGITTSATDGYATYMRLTGTTKLMFSAEL